MFEAAMYTNDSSVDVKIEHRSDFKGYPEGWRNE